MLMVKKNSKMMLISENAQCIHEFFFVKFSVFELLSILYFTVVNSDLGFTLAGKQNSGDLQNMSLALTCSD